MQRILLSVLGSLALFATPARAQTFIVNTFQDTTDDNPGDGICADANGLCSLRAAVMEANLMPGGATIILQGGTYLITRSGGGENAAFAGDLDLLRSVTIHGSSSGTTVIDGNGLDRVFDIWNGASVTMTGLQVRGGDPGIGSSPGTTSQHGGGIRVNDGHLTLTDVAVYGNEARLPSLLTPSHGGGIYLAQGSLQMNGGMIADNDATNGSGGGLYLGGDAVLDGVTIVNNSSKTSGGGVLITSGGVVELENVQVSSNSAGGSGGGIRSSGSLSIKDSSIEDNTADQSGGGVDSGGPLEVERSRIAGNAAGFAAAFGNGGGINSGGIGAKLLVDTAVEGNIAFSSGGGISNSTVLDLVRCTISGNQATTTPPAPGLVHGGGGIYNFVSTGVMTLTNCTVSGNQSPFGHGGGIANDSEGRVVMSASTLAQNSAQEGNSLYNGALFGPGAEILVVGSILDDTPSASENVVALVGSPITDLGHTTNADGTGMSPGPGSLYGSPGAPLSAVLGPLQDNGGFTRTHALLPGSPAIDAFASCSDAAGNLLQADQRGEPRPQDGSGNGTAVCDIGSFEAPAGSPQGGWQAVVLHPSAPVFSSASGVHGGQQAGTVGFFGANHAARWDGSSASWVDLHPSGASSSVVSGLHGGRQIGTAYVGSARASLWNGSAASHQDLHPFLGPDFSDSYGHGVWVDPGGAQIHAAGYGTKVGVGFQALVWHWNGSQWTAQSLDPAGSTHSRAYGAHGNLQVGEARIGSGLMRASLWSGSAASWQDLTPFLPTGYGGYTYASHVWTGGGATQIVGTARQPSSFDWRAILWEGSGSSWSSVDLTPAGASESEAFGVRNGTQVGYARVGGIRQASLWSGTATSWEDLHQYLPQQFFGPGEESFALAVWDDGGTTYVVGYARDTTSSSSTRAVMWVRTPSGPQVTEYCPGDGSGPVPCPFGNDNDGSVNGGMSGCANSASPGGAALQWTIDPQGQVTLSAIGVPSTHRLWFQGNNAVNGGHGALFGDGLRCVAGGVVRLETQSPTQPPVMSNPLPPVPPGQIRRFQLWFRDVSMGLTGSNLSNAVEIF